MPARPNGSATRLRVLHPAPGVLAFYDGRVEGYRPERILPSHGDPEAIEGGGYGPA